MKTKRKLFNTTRKSQDEAFRYLKTIKRPVMILVRDIDEKGRDAFEFDRVRILYPNGNCEYLYTTCVFARKVFNKSCFCRDNLNDTIDGMKAHQAEDQVFFGLRIFEVIEL